MVWMFLLGLAIWVLVIQIRLTETRRQLNRVEAPRPQLDEAAPHSEPASPRTGPVETPAPGGASVVEAEPAPIAAPAPVAAGLRVAAEPPARLERPAETSRPTAAPVISTWLAENGLAWLGGGALALGGSAAGRPRRAARILHARPAHPRGGHSGPGDDRRGRMGPSSIQGPRRPARPGGGDPRRRWGEHALRGDLGGLCAL